MHFTRDEVREIVIDTIREVLNKDGGVEIREETDPILGLGLDSDDGIDFACGISEKLNYNLPDNINPFVCDKPSRPRRVGEIVDLMCKLAQEGDSKNV
jgi:acyl carrier protein